EVAYINLKDLLIICIAASENGGSLIYKVRSDNNLNKTSKGKTKEGANDPLTNGDIYSNIIMQKTIKTLFPGIKIVSEEKNQLKDIKITNHIKSITNIPDQIYNQNDLLIWIDPLDATQEFTENLLDYVTTMVCVVANGEPIIGVIHKPFQSKNNTYWAWVGKGHSPNLERTTFTDQKNVIISRSHPGEIDSSIAAIIGQDNFTVVSAGGAGYKVLEVVSGRADIYLHTTYIKKWDICAGNAILNALGGSMVDLKGREIQYGDQNDYILKDGLKATRS
ncbi:unnamed protein product, partial [Gordionus sp. m RMFG-2023]